MLELTDLDTWVVVVLREGFYHHCYGIFLWEIRHPRTYIQAYADDIVLLFQGQDLSKLHETASRCLNTVNRWAVDSELAFSARKSEAIVFTWRRHWTLQPLLLGGDVINHVKYLGVTLDELEITC